MKGIYNGISLICVGYDLSFRSVSRQVFSALQSLTSVFGMGTGGPFALETLTRCSFEQLYWLRHCRWCTFRDSTPRCIIAYPHDQESVAFVQHIPSHAHTFTGAPSGIRTRDPLIKSQLLYQLS